MSRFYMQVNGQGIQLETYKGLESFSDALKKFVKDNAVNRKRPLDGILEFKLGQYRGNYFNKRKFSGNWPFVLEDKKAKILKGVYFIHPDFLYAKKKLINGIIYCALDRFSQACMKNKDILIFHAASMNKKGKGYVFSGRSGAGKTTICRITKNAGIIHDDRTVIIRNNKGYFLSPGFSMKRNSFMSSGGAKLERMFFIKQSRKNRLEKLTLKESLKEGLPQCINAVFKKDSARTFESLIGLFKNIPTYNLYFRKNVSFWRLIERAL